MPNSVRNLCGAGLLFATLASAAIAAPTKQADIDAAVRDAAQTFMHDTHVPGLAIAVVAGGHEHFYNFGVASRDTGRKVTSDTLFELGSISKTFNVTLAAYAQESGQLALTDSVDGYLPALQGTPFGKVSLINLGTHTAGGFPLQVPDAVADNDQLMAWLKAWQPQYPAGTQRTYANPSIGMLGVVTAKRMGAPYAEAVEKTLFPRLGLTNTYVRVPAGKMALYAQGYNSKDVPARLNPGVLADEAYGVKSSTRDMLRFVKANLGQVAVEPKLARALANTHVGYFKIGPMTQDLIWEQYAWPVTLDNLLQGNASHMVLENNPATALTPPLPPQRAVLVNKTGATNGFGGYVAFVPARQFGIVILANRNHPTEARLRLAYRLLELMAAPAGDLPPKSS